MTLDAESMLKELDGKPICHWHKEKYLTVRTLGIFKLSPQGSNCEIRSQDGQSFVLFMINDVESITIPTSTDDPIQIELTKSDYLKGQ